MKTKQKRNTKQREAIKKTLSKNPDRLFSAGELYKTVKTDVPNIGIATIYRNASEMAESGDCFVYQLGKSKYFSLVETLEYVRINGNLHVVNGDAPRMMTEYAHIEQGIITQ